MEYSPQERDQTQSRSSPPPTKASKDGFSTAPEKPHQSISRNETRERETKGLVAEGPQGRGYNARGRASSRCPGPARSAARRRCRWRASCPPSRRRRPPARRRAAWERDPPGPRRGDTPLARLSSRRPMAGSRRDRRPWPPPPPPPGRSARRRGGGRASSPLMAFSLCCYFLFTVL